VDYEGSCNAGAVAFATTSRVEKKAKAAGKYKGRKPTAKAKSPEIKRLMAEGIGKASIARQLGISRASVYRLLSSAPRRHPSTARWLIQSSGLFDGWLSVLRGDALAALHLR
jgi:DNA invertase Pin-like site-specific DNA recombinase